MFSGFEICLFVHIIFQLVKAIVMLNQLKNQLILVEVIVSTIEIIFLIVIIPKQSKNTKSVICLLIIAINIAFGYLELLQDKSKSIIIATFYYLLLLQFNINGNDRQQFKYLTLFIQVGISIFSFIFLIIKSEIYSEIIDISTYGLTLVFIIFLSQYEIKPQQKPMQAMPLVTQLEQIKQQQNNLIIQTPVSISQDSIISDDYDLQSYKKIMNIIAEGVAIVEIVSEQNNIVSINLEFQNQANFNIFGQNDSQLIDYFQILEGRIQKKNSIDRASIMSANSSIVFKIQKEDKKTSYLKKKFSLVKTKSKLSPVYNNQAPKSVLEIIKNLWRTKRFRFEVNKSVESVNIEVIVQNSDNTTKPMNLYIVLFSIDRVMIVSKEIYYREQIKKLINQNNSKSRTLAYVSHELRSPLNCMIYSLQNILELKLEPNLISQIGIILENSFHLATLSNDLLDLSQIKNDKFTLKFSNFNLITLCKECQNMFKMQAQEKFIQIDIKSNLSNDFIECDRNRLKQVLINLISNAIKYTQKGKISIILQQNSNLLKIGVKDTGIGISPENQLKLFKAFSKIENDQDEELNSQGIGLGLMISNKIVKLLAKSQEGILVESNQCIEQMGSFFYFYLDILNFHSNQKVCLTKIPNKSLQFDFPNTPLSCFGIVKDEAHNFQSSQEILDHQQCKHILVVDDNIFNIKIMEMMIHELQQHDIDTANNGQEAVRLAINKQCCIFCKGYKLILMDLDMPIMNGRESTKEIVKNCPETKIIIISGYEDDKEQQECLNSGACDYIVKPVKKDRIQQVFTKYFN